MAVRDPFRWRQGGHRFRDFVSQLLGPIAGWRCRPISDDSVADGPVTGGVVGGPIPIVGGSVANVPVAGPAGDGPVAGGLKQGLKLDAGHGNGNK